MLCERLSTECVLRPEDIAPSRDDLEVAGVFNPAAIEVDGRVLLMARIAERPRKGRQGYVGLPRWDPEAGPVVDWLPAAEVEPVDPRVVMLPASGRLRLTFVSHVRVFTSRDGRSFGPLDGAALFPASRYETYGVEDPRVVRLGDRFWITYVAVSEHGAATALASTADFRRFERHGVIFPPENKDVVLFPEAIGGDYVALHRPNPRMHFSAPAIWLARSPDLAHWGGHEAIHAGADPWEAGRIGAGAPPLKTERGWLEIYHGRTAEAEPGAVGMYSAGALLLDLEDPVRVLARGAKPLFAPEAEFERRGFVPGVVFPTGVVLRGDRLLVYCGAADTSVGLVELSLEAVLAALA